MRVRATVSIGSDTGGANDESRGGKGQSASFDQVHERSEERVIDGRRPSDAFTISGVTKGPDDSRQLCA